MFKLLDTLSVQEATQLSPITLAFIGDAVYTLYVREKLVFQKDEKGNEMKDSPAYEGYGNAVATVVAEYPIQNIIKILREEHEQCEN